MPLNSEFFERKNCTGTRSENSSKFWTTFTPTVPQRSARIVPWESFLYDALKRFSEQTIPDFPGWDKVPNLTEKLRQILKRSLEVCFDFDGSKFVSSGDVLFVKYFIHKLSRYEFIHLRKCQRGVFQNHGVCRQAFPFLASPPLPVPSNSVALALIFKLAQAYQDQSAANTTKSYSTLRKNERGDKKDA